MERKTVNINQAAQIAGVSRRTIYNWLNAARLEYVRTAGGQVRIYPDSLFRAPSGGWIKPAVAPAEPADASRPADL